MPKTSMIKVLPSPRKRVKATVFSNTRDLNTPKIKAPKGLKLNSRIKMDGIKFLSLLKAQAVPAVFFDPQYRGILDKMSYGNEGKSRGKKAQRAAPNG